MHFQCDDVMVVVYKACVLSLDAWALCVPGSIAHVHMVSAKIERCIPNGHYGYRWETWKHRSTVLNCSASKLKILEM